MRDQRHENGLVTWEGQSPEEVSGHMDFQDSGFMEHNHTAASQTLLARIIELHSAGHSAEEIAVEILTTEPENVLFRSAIMIEIILQFAEAARSKGVYE